MLGVADGKAPALLPSKDPAGPQAADAADTTPSRVAAVACFYPPTDWLNYGAEGKSVLEHRIAKQSPGLFQMVKYNAGRHAYEAITEEAEVRDLLQKLSPIDHVTAKA